MEAELTPYEQQREDRIKRNTDVLIKMGILTAASALSEAVLKSRRQSIAARTSEPAKRPPSEPSVTAEPARRSCRLKGEAPTLQPIEGKEHHRHVTGSMLKLSIGILPVCCAWMSGAVMAQRFLRQKKL